MCLCPNSRAELEFPRDGNPPDGESQDPPLCGLLACGLPVARPRAEGRGDSASPEGFSGAGSACSFAAAASPDTSSPPILIERTRILGVVWGRFSGRPLFWIHLRDNIAVRKTDVWLLCFGLLSEAIRPHVPHKTKVSRNPSSSPLIGDIVLHDLPLLPSISKVPPLPERGPSWPSSSCSCLGERERERERRTRAESWSSVGR